jgi:late competence protein required for DNA uptake (superfamily II DNA/RNA helicase)
MTHRWPWGHGPAPALRCDECGKRIGKPRTHFIPASENLLCPSCMVLTRSGSVRLHAKYYPDCPETWHDMWDHSLSHATRAGAWFVLPDPEKRTA